MKIQNYRYAYREDQKAPQQPIIEEATFVVCGTEGIMDSDPRKTVVDGKSCVLLSVTDPLYEIPELPSLYTAQKWINPLTGELEETKAKSGAIKNKEYWTSLFWRPYELPLSKGIVEITENEFWEMKSAYQQHLIKRRKTREDAIRATEKAVSDAGDSGRSDPDLAG